MQLEKIFMMGALTFACILSAAESAKKDNDLKVDIKVDRPDHIYKCGENVIFEIVVLKNDKVLKDGSILLKLTNDGLDLIRSEKIDLSKENPVKISATLKEPGFLRCAVSSPEHPSQKERVAAVGFDPEKIKPAVENPPADFGSFWEKGIKALEKIPIDVKMEKLSKFSGNDFECFRVSFASFNGTRIYGFLSFPMEKSGPFPALIEVPSAGPGYEAPDITMVKRGVIVLRMNVHRYDPVDPETVKNAYKELCKFKPYLQQDADNPEKYYLRDALLVINRAADWLAARADFDGKHLVIAGNSQGGGISLMIAALNKNITAAKAQIPAFADHLGYLKGRNSGGVNIVIKEKKKAEVIRTISYFDVVNFAGKIKCHVVVTVGFIDQTCSPSSVYAAYNFIHSPKQIFTGPDKAHEGIPAFNEGVWLCEQLGVAKK